MIKSKQTKAQLVAETTALRQRVAELEAMHLKREQAEATLQVSEIRYRRLFETAQDGILILDADTGQIADVNPFLEKCWGIHMPNCWVNNSGRSTRSKIARQLGRRSASCKAGAISGTRICRSKPVMDDTCLWSLSATRDPMQHPRHRLLSAGQERKLTLAVERGRIAGKRLARSRPTLSEMARRQLCRRIEQALTAREELVRSNARLVISVAKRYQSLGLPLMDLIQEGNIGLLRAIDGFEPARGLRLSTYATWWVRQGINRAVANQGRTIRLPAYLQDRVQQLSRAAQTLEQSLGRAPNETELAVRLAVAPADIRSLRAVAVPVVSLDDSLSEADDESPLEQLEDTQITPVEELVARNMLREAMERALDELPARHALVVRLRYGLNGDQPHTLEDIAQKLSLSRERVRQIEREAFSRLRLSADVRNQRFPQAM